MFETVNKLMLAGLGALSMTRERAEKIFDEYVRRGQAAKDEREGFISDLMDSAERARRDLEDVIGRQLQNALNSLDVVRRQDLARVEAKLDILLARGKETPPGLA